MSVTTVTVWLLISIGSMGSRSARPTVVVERFAERQECVRIMEFLNGTSTTHHNNRAIHTCVDARIAVLPRGAA